MSFKDNPGIIAPRDNSQHHNMHVESYNHIIQLSTNLKWATEFHIVKDKPGDHQPIELT